MGLVTYKRSIGSRHPYKPVPAGPGLHCLGWPVSVAHDMYQSLPATSCTGGVRRRSRYLALTFFPCTRCAFFESSELLTHFLYGFFIQLYYLKNYILMRSGKNVQRTTRATGIVSSDSVVPDRQEDIGSSTQPTTSTAQPSTSNIEP